MRTLLYTAASGAVVWAVAVSGVENNPAFAVFLVMVAAVCFVAGLYSAHLIDWRLRFPMLVIGMAAFAGALFFGVGAWLLGRHPEEPESANVDQYAREQLATTQVAVAEISQQLKGLEAALRDERASKEEAQRQLDDRDKRAAIRERLGQFIKRGRQLQVQSARESDPPPNKEANAWAAETEAFLQQNCGESYVARFQSAAGLPLAMNSIQSIPHRQLWGGLESRLARLEQFIGEYAR